MAISDEQHFLLIEIINNTERTDKLKITLNHETRSMVVEYFDLDDEWFKEMSALVNGGPNGNSPDPASSEG